MTTSGTVTAVSADSITVKTGSGELKFSVDKSTNVVARGAGTKARAAQKAGKAGPALTDVVSVGDQVAVTYHDMGGGNLHAATIRVRAKSAK